MTYIPEKSAGSWRSSGASEAHKPIAYETKKQAPAPKTQYGGRDYTQAASETPAAQKSLQQAQEHLKPLSKAEQQANAKARAYYIREITNLTKKYKPDQIEKAYSLLKSMKAEGIKPDVFCYGKIIRGYGNIGDFKKFDTLLTEMTESSLQPDAESYHFMIKAYIKHEKYDAAFDTYRKIEKRVFETDNSIANVITTLVHTLAKTPNTKEARSVYDDMKTYMKPTSCRALLDIFRTKIFVDSKDPNYPSDL
jgi:pentatricopeptide repeat protein